MNHNTIETIFLETTEQYPLNVYQPSMTWFNAILAKITTPQTSPPSPTAFESQRGFLSTKVEKTILNNQTRLSFNSMYIHLLMKTIDEKLWSVKDFNTTIKTLMDYRATSASPEVKMLVKVWLNMIYGATNNSCLRCGVDVRAYITDAGYAIMERLFKHPLVLYIDTDTAIIDDDIESVSVWLPDVLQTDVPYMLDAVQTVAIFKVKSIIYK
jgi:hypothetical protein